MSQPPSPPPSSPPQLINVNKMDALITTSLKLRDSGNVIFSDPPTNITIGKKDITEYAKERILLPTGSADVEQDMAQVDGANILLLRTDTTISIKKNSAAGEEWSIPADRASDGTQTYGLLLITTTGITKLYFTNASGNTATIELIYAS